MQALFGEEENRKEKTERGREEKKREKKLGNSRLLAATSDPAPQTQLLRTEVRTPQVQALFGEKI